MYLAIKEGIDLVCILGGDLDNEGATLGKRTVENDQIGGKLCGKLHDEGWEPYIVLSAGEALTHGHNNKYPMQRESLAAMMRDYLVNKLKISAPILIPRLTWGTLGELETLQVVESRLEEQGKYVHQRHIVVSWWHAPRAWLIAHRLFGDKFEIHRTPADLSITDFLRELRNIGGECLRQYVPGFGVALRFLRGRD